MLTLASAALGLARNRRSKHPTPRTVARKQLYHVGGAKIVLILIRLNGNLEFWVLRATPSVHGDRLTTREPVLPPRRPIIELEDPYMIREPPDRVLAINFNGSFNTTSTLSVAETSFPIPAVAHVSRNTQT